ncbi:MAG: hypothetical protein MUF59_09735 [Candidatus Krumholzibacteria bacterium]|jgi:hypothetical protein|nr:hypothetical protein [Candidatus Krumholzibacteria bacterium]
MMTLKKNRTKNLVMAPFLAALLLALLPAVSNAIPAFARKYKFSCTTCHAPAPRLKAYGEDFAGNAFQLPDGEEPARAFHDTGDDLLTLQRDYPIAVRFDAYMQSTYNKDRGGMNDLKTPYGIKILSGGNISSSIGYYFYFYMSEQGEVAGVEDAYVHFNNLFGTELDIMAGQFQVSDPLFKRELRLTYEDYLIYKTRVGESPTNLAYDRGLMFLYGLPTGTDIVLQIVNGNGIGEKGESGFFDADEWKNTFLRVSQQAGPVRLGGFGYLCNTRMSNSGNSEPEKLIDNRHYYWGVDGTVDFKDRVQLNAQYLERYDENPDFLADKPADEIKTSGGFAELVWLVRGEMGRPFVTLLYNHMESDYEGLDHRSMTAGFSYLLRRNFRLLAEATYEAEREDYGFTAGASTAF